jgi:hypothetical protein
MGLLGKEGGGFVRGFGRVRMGARVGGFGCKWAREKGSV